ncbi:MAG: AAA family ATPase [Zestosphaera tikiterensis]|uniref:AAA family ATPase n=1 Tax=Zestosphaera tikiterensis TaxID=1973259 RepID=A0A2R7Y673_9CREN|nr:MAG: AAA family ATPase [Zestosphaera tikiterensis]
MSSNSLPYLENAARHYAIQAVLNDREGNYGEAIKNYRNAIEVLNKIIQLYPDNPLNTIYKDWIKQYHKRIKDLESLRTSLLPATGSRSSESDDEDLEEFILKEKPKVTFEDVADLEHVKQAFFESIIYPTKRPDLFPLGWPRGILLFGPPGCGKTYVAAAVANEVDGYFIHVDAASIMSKWLGEAEKRVAKIFSKARDLAAASKKPVIIFIDEVDSLLSSFNAEVGGETRVRNQFLKEMDGLQDKDKTYFVYVIAATNKPWKLDDAFIRRFQKRIYIPLPNKEARLQLIKLYTKKLSLSPDVDFSRLADALDGYTASDIKDIVMTAHLRTVRELFARGSHDGVPRPITMEDFMEVLKERKPSVNKELIKVFESWDAKFKAI